MLNTISWQQYIVAVLFLNSAWYAYVGLRYFRPEISRLLRFKPQTDSVMPEVAHFVMATIQTKTGTSLQEPQGIIFSIATADEVSEATFPKGPADDLLAEAEALVSAFEKSDDKKGFPS